MKWIFKKDKRLLAFPLVILLLTCSIFFIEQLRISFRILIVIWSVIYFAYFFRLHIAKDLEKSCDQIQYLNSSFQLLKNNDWIDVVISDNSLVSYWLLSIQWKVVDVQKENIRKSYSMIILPSSLEKSEYTNLVWLLSQKARSET